MNINTKKSDRYSLTCDVSSMTETELRDLKFGLNFRYIAHMKKNHNEARLSCKAVTDQIRAELALRAQERSLNDALKG